MFGFNVGDTARRLSSLLRQPHLVPSASQRIQTGPLNLNVKKSFLLGPVVDTQVSLTLDRLPIWLTKLVKVDLGTALHKH